MKNIVKKTTLIVATFFLVAIGNAQKTYLRITKNIERNDVIMYPPGTKFELKNKHGYILFKNSDDPGVFSIDDEYTLYVFPTWKDDVDKFKLTEGIVEKVLTSSNGKSDYNAHTIKSNGETANYTVTDSEEREGKKNLEFKLSNGITFIYEDDKYRAYLNKEDNYIRIKGKYLIETQLGTLKLSFNPNNGVVWWIFEKN